MLYIHAKAPREQLLQKNYKHGLRPKDFNKNKDTPKITGSLQQTIPRTRPKINSVRFEDPYDYIYHMDHNHENNHLIDTQ